MAGDSYWSQAMFWAGEYRRRAPKIVANALPPAVNARVVQALEARARPRDLSLATSFHRVREIVVESYELAEPELVQIPAVDGLLALDGFWFPPVRVHHLTDVKLDVASGLIFARTWVVNGTGTGLRREMDSAFVTGATVRVRSGKSTRETRMVAPLGNHIDYYHFLMETLPQVLRVRQVHPKAVFITSIAPSGTSRTILKELGIDVSVMNREAVLACESVVFCESMPRDRTHPADMQLLFDTFATERQRSSEGSRVYISRARSLRALADEAHLESYLSSQGFRVLFLEELAFPEQVAALNAASIVVAPHGAGLANAVFMPRGGRVVELATGEWWSSAFRRIAHCRGHDYRLVMLESTAQNRWGTAEQAVSLVAPLLLDLSAESIRSNPESTQREPHQVSAIPTLQQRLGERG